MGKSQLERQKKAKEPFLPGSQACEKIGEKGLWVLTPVLSKVHSLGMNGEEREARASQ